MFYILRTDDGTVIVSYVTLVAVVGRLVLDPTLVGNLLAAGHKLVSQDLDVLHGLEQAVSVRNCKEQD